VLPPASHVFALPQRQQQVRPHGWAEEHGEEDEGRDGEPFYVCELLGENPAACPARGNLSG
jgi:hypothetical protein